MKPPPWPVVLASASPRRHDLLREIIADFTIDAPGIDEDSLTDPDPWITAQRLAKEKALAIFDRHPDSLVIAGDTVVALRTEGQNSPGVPQWRQLAKPVDAEDAFAMLSELQGRTHTVITGVCLRWPTGLSSFTESSEVTFKPMSAEEIRAYIATGEPMDKAGAYGLQGGARPFISQVRGDVNTVIGLPVDRLREALVEAMKAK